MKNPQPPKGLGKEAAALFRAVVKEKKEQGTLSEAALPLVEMYVCAVEGFNLVTAEILKETTNPTYQDGGQRERLNPLFRQQRSYSEQALKAAQALGITPHHRERWLKQQEPEEQEDESQALRIALKAQGFTPEEIEFVAGGSIYAIAAGLGARIPFERKREIEAIAAEIKKGLQ